MNWHKIIPSKKHIRYGFITLFVIVIIGLISCYFSDIAKYFFSETQKYNGELFKVLVTILGGLIVIWGLYLNYRRTKTLEVQTNNQAEQIKAFVKQNEIAEKGKVDERFKNAIEHLGHDKDAIVLGGIYALHRIAQEDKSYRKTVFDILCSYLREKTSSLKLWADYQEGERVIIKPTIVIQTIIDLLFKCDVIQKYIYTGFRANLNGIRCIKADFKEAYLEQADLTNAHLEGAELKKVRLEGAFLSGSHFTDAYLEKAHLENATIMWGHWEGIKLFEAHLQGANLLNTHLEGAVLWDSHLEGAGLYGVHMEGAVLNDTHLENAYLAMAQMKGTQLRGTHLEGADLNGAHLEGADLTNAHLEAANINNIFLEGANLTGSHFEGVYLSKARLQKIKHEKVSITDVISKEYRPLDFTYIIKKRIGEKNEFYNNQIGKLHETLAKDIIEKISPKIKDGLLLFDFQDKIKEAVGRDNNIEKDAITGALTKEKADEIIERYNKAMANVPKR